MVASLLLAACGTWEAREASGFARQEVSFSYSPATQRFYLAGGYSTVHEAYDPATDSWSTVAPLPERLNHIVAVEVDGLVYYVGGIVSFPDLTVGSVHIYDPVTDEFSVGAPMPAGRERGAGGAAAHGGRIYYAGGLHAGQAVPWLDVYDPATDTWTSLPDMPEARDHFAGAVVDDRFHAIGGRRRSANATTPNHDAFDLTTQTWTAGLAPLPSPRGGYAVAVLGRRILVIGGEGGGTAYSTVEAYHTGTDSWSTLAPMPTARHGIQAAVCDGAVYVPAGATQQGSGSATAVHEVFSLDGPGSCGPT